MFDPYADLVLAYLRNMQAAQMNGQSEHAEFLFTQALEWLRRYDNNLWKSMPVRFSLGIGLDRGTKRKSNEDYAFAERAVRSLPNGSPETIGVFVVADGMGGHVNGQEASRLAVHAFVDCVFRKLVEKDVRGSALKDVLIDGVREANRVVYQRSLEVLQSGESMGTTITAALSVGAEVYIASIGDSRCYLFRPGSGLIQLTRDHSLVADLLRNHYIEPEDVYTHPRRNEIYRSLGEASVEIDEPVYLQLQDGDILLFCSDGLWEMVRDPEEKALVTILSDTTSEAKEMAELLVDLALNNGGLDNIGLLVVQAMIQVEGVSTIRMPLLSSSAANPITSFI